MKGTYRETNAPAPPIRRRIYPIQYGANHQIVGKSDPQLLSHPGAWQSATGTMADLAAHIGKGHPWMPALLDGNGKRWQSNANSAEVLALDIDSGMSIEEAKAHPFIAAYCSLGIESHSSTLEQPKFRLVFRNPFVLENRKGPQQENIPGWQIIRACNEYLGQIIDVADPSCKDASRFFFGAQGRKPFILDEFKRLPETFVNDALAWKDGKEKEAERQYQEALVRRAQLRSADPQDNTELVRQALSCIPPREVGSGNYPDCIRVLMALYNEFGAAEAEALGEEWSPSIARSTWNVSKKIESFERSRPTRNISIGTVFYLAQQNGFRFPERQSIAVGKPLVQKAKAANQRPEPARTKLEQAQEKTQHWLGQVLLNLEVRANWEREPDRAKAIRLGREMVAKRALSRNSLRGETTVGFFPRIELAPTCDRVLYTLDGQKGTGKSQSAIKSLVDACKRGMLSAAIFAPTRLLCESLAAVLEVPTIYTDNRSPITVLCPESAWKLAGRTFDVLIADEANECLQRLAEGSLGNEPQLCREQFQRILKGASTIVLAQDGLSRHCVDTASRLAGIEPEQIQTLRRRRQDSAIAIALYPDRAIGRAEEGQAQKANDAKLTWLFSLISALESGQRIAIPCGSQNAAREISRLLRSHFKRAKKIQVFDGRDSFQQAKTEFCQSPDQWLQAHQIDALIFTPCFNSGVSIESEYFDIQFEYATPFETAESISQRGERVRDAIWGNRIQQRHIYLSSRGLAAQPDPAIFTGEYWASLLRADAIAPLDQAQDIALAIGAHPILDKLRTKELARLDTWQELPEMLAYQSLQTYFKREFLEQEWKGNGWSVTAIPSLPDEALKPLRELWRTAREDLIEQRSRIIARCQHYEDIDIDCEETSGPVERTRLVKKALAIKTNEHEGIHEADWVSSWVTAPGNSGLNQIRVNALVRLAINNPDKFQELQTWRALRLIGSAATLETLAPSIPASDRELELAALLIQCQAIRDILTGELTQWDKHHPRVQDAAQFARDRAAEFARLSKHNQRIHGFQFTAKTPDIKCVHKLLQMVGVSAIHHGRKGQIHQYRLETEADLESKILAAMERLQPTQPLVRKAYRLQTGDGLSSHLQNHFESAIAARTPDWDIYTQKLAAKLSSIGGLEGVAELQLIENSSSSEVLPREKIPLWVQLSALVRQAKDWSDFQKIGALFPTKVKQRIWDALGKADFQFRRSIFELRGAT